MKGELLLLSSVVVLLRGVGGCPEKCRCHSTSNSVDCSRQGLVEVPPDLPPQTLTLHLQDNQIHQLPAFAFRSVPQLTTLNLCNNSLSNLAPGAFHGLQHLQVLDLTQNSLHSLEGRLFHSLPQLRELYLSSNNISRLPTSLGEHWENLTIFAIQQNQLQQLSRMLLESMPSVKLLFLKDNIWKCNCHLLGLKLWLETFIYKDFQWERGTIGVCVQRTRWGGSASGGRQGPHVRFCAALPSAFIRLRIRRFSCSHPLPLLCEGGVLDSVVCASPDTWQGEDLLKIPHELYQPCPWPSSDLGSAHRAVPRPPESHSTTEQDHAECGLKAKPRPAKLRHAVVTVIITGVACGILCLLMLAAAIYGCTYAAITARYRGGPLAQTNEPAKTEGKELFDSSPA
ncbi:leucine-rich repeat and transmembrane domain-containing protein 1 isoform X3 [Saccopteryx bilineata]|uniref:leucine-rich repeat and transmembrane domain-containing protein 1 isoform X3 n=1 Tax=Saccopteryx bilineata TaxID=59482 RepID=UPI00339028E2